MLPGIWEKICLLKLYYRNLLKIKNFTVIKWKLSLIRSNSSPKCIISVRTTVLLTKINHFWNTLSCIMPFDNHYVDIFPNLLFSLTLLCYHRPKTKQLKKLYFSQVYGQPRKGRIQLCMYEGLLTYWCNLTFQKNYIFFHVIS